MHLGLAQMCDYTFTGVPIMYHGPSPPKFVHTILAVLIAMFVFALPHVAQANDIGCQPATVSSNVDIDVCGGKVVLNTVTADPYRATTFMFLRGSTEEIEAWAMGTSPPSFTEGQYALTIGVTFHLPAYALTIWNPVAQQEPVDRTNWPLMMGDIVALLSSNTTWDSEKLPRDSRFIFKMAAVMEVSALRICA